MDACIHASLLLGLFKRDCIVHDESALFDAKLQVILCDLWEILARKLKMHMCDSHIFLCPNVTSIKLNFIHSKSIANNE